MQTLTEKIFSLSPPGGFFDSSVVENLFPGLTVGAKKALVNRALSKGEVIRLKAGIYCLEPKYRKSELHPYVIAGMLYSNSYISFESALSYHNLIPEMVYSVSSASASRSRIYQTRIGNYSYTRIPATDFKAGVEIEKFNNNSWAFVATPIRAIADLVYSRKSVSWKADSFGFLLNSMRMDEDELQRISFGHFEDVYNAIRNQRTRDYLIGLKSRLEK